jgi:thioredoxin 1
MAKVFQNYQELQSEISKNGVVLLDCFTSWCGPCKMMAPIIEELAHRYEGRALVVKVDVEAVEEAGYNFKISSVPTLLVFKNGKEVAREIGYKPKDALVKLIEKNL